MKKSVIVLMIVFAGIFIASCVMDRVYYCPYCGTAGASKSIEYDNLTPYDVYECGNSSCGKKFGARER